MTKLSRKLRSDPTEAEKYLWSRLKGRQMHGVKFRRQSPVGKYVVDFICFEKRLIVGVDGGQHAESLADIERTKDLQDAGVFGFEVLES